MKWILITPPYFRSDEAIILHHAFEIGVHRIHIRKPEISSLEQMETYLDTLEETIFHTSSMHYWEEWLGKYPFNGFHLSKIQRKKILDEESKITKDKNILLSSSFHSPNELENESNDFNYGFCSPVFTSISKQAYYPKFNWNLNNTKASINTFALGGITLDKIANCKEKGFDGIAILGTIWQHKTKDAMIQLDKINKECDHLS